MPTILMVVKPPIYFNESYKKYRVKQNEPLRFFLYDKETSLIVSCISEIFLQENWKESLSYMILTAEDRLNRSECPKCKFWLVERENELRQRFMGCSGYPDCNFTANIHDIYDDYEF
jgi:ssDNA-binding Zn-finger/Zn-ribbon topoisomerase 1